LYPTVETVNITSCHRLTLIRITDYRDDIDYQSFRQTMQHEMRESCYDWPMS